MIKRVKAIGVKANTPIKMGSSLRYGKVLILSSAKSGKLFMTKWVIQKSLLTRNQRIVILT